MFVLETDKLVLLVQVSVDPVTGEAVNRILIFCKVQQFTSSGVGREAFNGT